MLPVIRSKAEFSMRMISADSFETMVPVSCPRAPAPSPAGDRRIVVEVDLAQVMALPSRSPVAPGKTGVEGPAARRRAADGTSTRRAARAPSARGRSASGAPRGRQDDVEVIAPALRRKAPPPFGPGAPSAVIQLRQTLALRRNSPSRSWSRAPPCARRRRAGVPCRPPCTGQHLWRPLPVQRAATGNGQFRSRRNPAAALGSRR